MSYGCDCCFVGATGNNELSGLNTKHFERFGLLQQFKFYAREVVSDRYKRILMNAQRF
ncbi:MAG: hypothetical protein IJ150_12345 [Bacteroidales bacterium]|nr:hypothetical protein [Bacteroidales bacterium]